MRKEENRDQTAKTVLVVDDEPALLGQIKKRIEAHQFRCLTAEDPVEGLRIAAKEIPNLILLDLMLPKMSGFGFLRIVKRNPYLAHIPVVVLTALGDEEVAMEAMDLGASAFLTKACEPHEIILAVKEYAI